MEPVTFTHRSILPASAERVFAWHERPNAVLDLMPVGRWARIEERTGGIRDGDRIVFSIGIGPLRVRWEARHFGYIENQQFRDEQVRGPFAVWRHTHTFKPTEDGQCAYQDSVEYLLPGGRLLTLFAGPFVRRALDRAFARRHFKVRAGVS